MKKLFLGLSVGVVIVGLVYLFCPKPDLITFTTYSKAFVDRNDQLLRISLAEDQRYRLYTKFDAIADNIKQATILYEDKDFYRHAGVDFFAILRAFWATYINGDRRIGASTITMQVARLRWQIPSYSLTGKFHQILRAIQLTRHYSKEEILEAYLNLAPYGGNIEGIGAASLIYFDKKASELSLPEALTLAVIPQNPNKRRPNSDKGFKALSSARDHLFEKWLVAYPEDQHKTTYMNLPLKVRSTEQLPFSAPHFVNYLNEILPRWDGGYIHTSLNSIKQQQVDKIVSDYIARKNTMGIRNASVLLLNYKTMQIEAMLGSVNFNNDKIDGQVNGALAKRSPGSTLKPFVYALAMDEGLIHPMTLMKDSPTRFGGFTPENYDKQFLGPVLAKDALITSRNVPAVALQALLENNHFYSFLQKAGISQLKEPSFYGLALALGGAEVSMLELVTLYAMLGNGGRLLEPSGLNIEQKSQQPISLLSPEASYITLSMLKDNPAPDSIDFDVDNTTSLYKQKNDVAWKTGTSWAFRDAWAIGLSGDYVLAVWVGNFNGSGNDNFIGRSAAGPLFFSLFDALVPRQGWSIERDMFSYDLNIKRVEMCKNTGDLPNKHCANKESAWFIPGISPIKVSTIYREIPILKSSGKRACWYDPEKTELQVYEFWPSDFLTIFQQAGILLKTPPAYGEDCSLDQKSASGQQPLIRSPQSNIEYVLQEDSPESNQIALAATVDPDAKILYWFVNDSYVGSVSAGKDFFWQAKVGRHDVRVVDDSGRSASKLFSVIGQ